MDAYGHREDSSPLTWIRGEPQSITGYGVERVVDDVEVGIFSL